MHVRFVLFFPPLSTDVKTLPFQSSSRRAGKVLFSQEHFGLGLFEHVFLFSLLSCETGRARALFFFLVFWRETASFLGPPFFFFSLSLFFRSLKDRRSGRAPQTLNPGERERETSSFFPLLALSFSSLSVRFFTGRR